MKGLIFGKGFFGTRLSLELGYELSGIDVLNKIQLEEVIDSIKPDVIINAVGKTGKPNIDWCKNNKAETIQGNIIAPLNISTACAEKGIYFVHLGTGCIYSGDNNGKGFSEEDEPNFYGPQFYAKTKILSEKALAELPGLQIRIRLPVDDRPHSKNLIDKLLKYPQIVDIQNSITTVPHMIKAIEELIIKKKEGIYNMTNPGTISAVEIIRMYQEIIDPSHKFQIISSASLDNLVLDKRSNCMLNSNKLEAEGIFIPEIHEAVKSCLIEYKKFVR